MPKPVTIEIRDGDKVVAQWTARILDPTVIQNGLDNLFRKLTRMYGSSVVEHASFAELYELNKNKTRSA